MRRFAVIATIIILMVPQVAQASCTDYFSAKTENESQMQSLLWEYKGVAATVLGCAGICMTQEQSEVGQCVIGACALGCLMVGIDHCFAFFQKQYALEQSKKRIDNYGRTHQCRQ